MHEIRKYKTLILKKSGLDEEAFEDLFDHLLRQISLVPDELIHKNLGKSRIIMDKIDPKDTVFIAAALSQNAIIWSDDKHMSKQNKVTVFPTRIMVNLLNR